jgi:hypothetical protein
MNAGIDVMSGLWKGQEKPIVAGKMLKLTRGIFSRQLRVIVIGAST